MRIAFSILNPLKPIFLTRPEIDISKWNTCIEASIQRVVYGYSWYLDIVAEDWIALVSTSETNYEIVMPLPVVYRYGIPVLHQPHFCQYLGIFSQNLLTFSDTTAFIRAVWNKFSYISAYSFHPLNQRIVGQTLKELSTIRYSIHQTVWMSIHNVTELAYSKDRRNNLKRAERHNWELVRGLEIDTLLELFKENHTLQIEGGVSEKSYKILSKLWSELNDRQSADLLYARLKEKVQAGILLFQDGPMVIYIFNAATKNGRDGNARTWLLHRYFESKSGQGLIFDFESPGKESIYQFYLSFGGNKMNYITIKKDRLCFPWNLLQNLRRRLIKARRALFSILYRT